MIHIAIVDKATIDNIMQNKKTIESRFSKNKITPYNTIENGETVYLKKSGGYISAKFVSKNIMVFKDLSNDKIKELKNTFNDKIAAKDNYWNSKLGAHYGTLIEISDPQPLIPFKIIKKNRSGWMSYDIRNNAINEPIIIGLSGAIASGKSIISAKLAEILGGAKYTFSDMLKNEMKKRNLEINRENMQHFSSGFIRELGYPGFTEALLKELKPDSPKVIIIDGIRHIGVLDYLSSKYSHFISIYVEADFDTRYERYIQKNNTNKQQFMAICSRDTESEIKDIKILSNIHINNNVDDLHLISKTCEDIAEFIISMH